MKINRKLIGLRIYLRTLGGHDATAEYCGWLNDPEVNKFLNTKSATMQGLKDYILQKNEEADTLFLGIFVNENDKHIGTVKLDAIRLDLKRGTIAILVGDKNYWGMGIAGEAIRLLSDYGFKELGLKEIYLSMESENKAAIRAYSKLGFCEVKVAEGDPILIYNPNLNSDIVMVLESPDRR